MPKLTPYEAPLTGYHIDDRGSTAYEHLAVNSREAGAQRNALIHQEGKSLQQGMTELGKGMNDFNADAKTAEAKADKHDELQDAVVSNNEYAQLHISLLKSFNDAKNKA